MKGMGHKKGKGGVPLPKVKTGTPSQGSTFPTTGAASNGPEQLEFRQKGCGHATPLMIGQ